MSTRALRKVHRVLGLLIGLQLLAWTGSGLFFSLNPIGQVRGTTEKAPETGLKLAGTAPLASPSTAAENLRRSLPGPAPTVMGVELRRLPDGLVYVLTYESDGSSGTALADAVTGDLRPELSEEEAKGIARADFLPDAPVLSAERVAAVEGGSEYRGKPLPAYRVTFDHALGSRIYVSAITGEVTARRNDRWRWFDFFWMLHIADYGDRENFNTWWLSAISLAGIATVLSGFLLLGFTSRLLRRRRGRGGVEAG